MNRDDMLNWLVDNFEEWPDESMIAEDMPNLPDMWSYHFSSPYRCFHKKGSSQIPIFKFDYIKAKAARNTTAPSKYHVKNIWQNCEFIDFYQMYDMYKLGKPHEVGDSAIEHAWKKITDPGNRSGGKSKLQDLREAVDSLNRAIDDIERIQL